VRSVLGGVRRVARASIWARGSVSAEDARLSRLLRRTLPEFYIAMWAFGSLGVLGGVPALRQTFGQDYAIGLSFALAAASLACFAGIVLPARLSRFELYGAGALGGLLILYAIAVLIAGLTTGDLGRTAVAAAIYGMSTLPRWRVTDVARERRVHGWK